MTVTAWSALAFTFVIALFLALSFALPLGIAFERLSIGILVALVRAVSHNATKTARLF